MKKLLLFLVCCATLAHAQQSPKVLIVTAHPDDETSFSVTVFKITHDLKGTVDLALMTDAQGGFNGSELGSVYYGFSLTDSVIGRERLPTIRKQELMNAGQIMGIRNYFFFDQRDDLYTQDEKPYAGGTLWDIPYIEKRLDQILARENYDFIFVLVPHAGQHGHHKTASLMGLRAAQRYRGAKKPIVLGGGWTVKGSEARPFEGLEGYPETKILKDAPLFTYDRSVKFGHRDLLTYKIVADWVIAEYKSQGDLQENLMHRGDVETFRYFAINPRDGIA
ncbi:PIG-L family deacetylase, partial [Persicitalea sp.]|uniref:PIG-L family deacetylase n=1 Tax=Persicitalea sp. TaxID=3100273 RepID=UPI00359444B5